MTDPGSGPYALSYVLREEFEALKGDDQSRQTALDVLAAAIEADADQDELQRREAVYRAAHKLGLSALCLSGGGIRSASVSLGVIQGLAETGC